MIRHEAEEIVSSLESSSVMFIIFTDGSKVETSSFSIPTVEELMLHQELRAYMQQYYKRKLLDVGFL